MSSKNKSLMEDNVSIKTMISIGAFAMLGVSIRVWITIPSYISTFFIPSLLTNIVGSLMLGILNGYNLNHKIILKTGISTGLCGSVTTYASFNYETNILIINKEPKIGYYLLSIIMTIGLSMTAYKLGQYLGACIPKYNNNCNNNNECSLRYWILFFIIMFIINYVLSIFLLIEIAIAVILGPCGAILRWKLGKMFNKNKDNHIKYGTYIANILGSIILGIIIQITDESIDIRLETEMVAGIVKGFCSCLTTVSTFISELNGLYVDTYNKYNNAINDNETQNNKSNKCIRIKSIWPPLCYFLASYVTSQLLVSIPVGIYEFVFA